MEFLFIVYGAVCWMFIVVLCKDADVLKVLMSFELLLEKLAAKLFYSLG